MDIDQFLTEQIASFAFAGFVFAIAGILLYFLRSFAQYKTAKKLKMEHSWFAFFPVFSWLQIFQMGGHKIWWALLIFVPALLELLIPVEIALWLLLVVFVGLLIKTIMASMNVLKKCKSNVWYGLFLFLPIVNIFVFWDCAGGSSCTKKYTSRGQVLSILILGTIVSLVSLSLIFILLGWIGFGNDFWSVLRLLADPATNPALLFEQFIGSSLN